jgi:hypothetical protein
MKIIGKLLMQLLLIILFSCTNDNPSNVGKDGTNDNGKIIWDILTFDNMITDYPVYPSIGLDSNGIIHIVYCDQNIFKYAKYDGSFQIKKIFSSARGYLPSRLTYQLLIKDNIPIVSFFDSDSNFILSASIVADSFIIDTLFCIEDRFPDRLSSAYNINNELTISYLYSDEFNTVQYLAINTKRNDIWLFDSILVDHYPGDFSQLFTNRNGVHVVWNNGSATKLGKYDGSIFSKDILDSLKQILVSSFIVDLNDNPYFIYMSTEGMNWTPPLMIFYKESNIIFNKLIVDSFYILNPTHLSFDNRIHIVYVKMIADHRNQIIYCNSENDFEKVLVADHLDNENGGYPFIMKNNLPVICYYERNNRSMKLIIGK